LINAEHPWSGLNLRGHPRRENAKALFFNIHHAKNSELEQLEPIMKIRKKTIRSRPKSKRVKPGAAAAESKSPAKKRGAANAPGSTPGSWAGLTGENPNPVLCAAKNGAVLYANRASAPLLKKWRCGKGENLPPEWIKRVKEALGDRRTVIAEESAGKRLYIFDVVPHDGDAYACLYGRDATEQKRAENVLRESESHYRSLFDNMLNGFALCRMIFSRGKPKDFIYLAVNESFERLTGLKNVVGKKVSEVIPGIRKTDPGLFEIYGRVAMTGRPEYMETWVESLERWFSISVYSSRTEHFVVVFDVITERKRAETALQNSEKKLREAQEMAHLGFWNWDVKTGAVEWSEEVFKIFCLDPKRFKPNINSILELSPWPEDHQRDQELIRKAIETRNPGSYEQKFLRPDKSIGYYYSTFQGNYDEKGGLVSIVGTVLDITDRKRAEQDLRESEDRFRSLYENATIGIYRTTPEGRILLANPALVSMLGYGSFEELAERDLSQASYEAGYPRREFQERIDRDGAISGLESAWKRRDGSTVFVRESARLIRDDDGRPLYYDGVAEDISGRKLMEDALRESEDKFKYIFDHSVIGKSITFPTGEIHVNEAFCKMLGYSSDTFEGRRWQDVSHPEDIELTQKVVDSLLSGEKDSARFIKRYLHKNGSIVWTEVATALRRDAADKPLYFMTALIDITHRMQAEEKLRALNSRQTAILDAVPDIIMEVDQNKVYMWANQPGMEFFGDDVVGREAQYYFEGEQETYRRVEPLFKGNEKIIYVESWQRRRDGEKRLLTWWCRVLKDVNGEVTGALSTARDVTELRRAEAALLESEHHLRRFYESKLIGVIYWNMNGKITDANDKFLEMVGYTPDELAEGSIDWLNMTPPEYRLKDEQSVEELKATGVNKAPFEKEYIRKDGSRIPVIIAGAMLDEARFNGVAFVLEITDRKRAELDIRRQMEELQRWHDLTLDRETRAMELKHEVNELLVRLGETIRYPSQENGSAIDR
jgi:PAS domain S-box-containing protein